METISFEDLGLDSEMLSAVQAKGFEQPTPIQILAIPRLLDGDANVIAKARTGTGKTAAFGLPLVQTIREDKGHPQALVLTPTRELALQVCKEIQSFSTARFPRLAAVYGGQAMGEQLRSLRKGVEIVVGTPGRVKDHIERGSLRLEQIDFFVLDEADEMLDMGFIEDIELIFSKANPESRVLLFSATMPPPILKIASAFMGDYEIVEEETGPEQPLLTEQKYWFVRESEKIEALVRMIDISPDFYGLIFTQTKSDADAVSRMLDERGYEAAALHGDIPQSQREKILSRFRSKKTRILVATDVAARGIDIEGLTHVVNYALPFDGPTYVHRIGRTGRAGAKGLAFTLVRPEERRKLEFLKQSVRKAIKGEMREASVPSVEDVLSAKRLRLLNELKRSIGLPVTPCTTAVSDAVNEKDTAGAIPAANGVVDDPTADTADAPTADVLADAPADTTDAPKAVLPESTFVQMAEDLCKNRSAQDVLASVLASVLGSKLDPKRYGTVSTLKGGRSSFSGRSGSAFANRSGSSLRSNAPKSGQMRLYVGLGRRDGFNAKEIAEFFSSLLHIPQRLVDRIDVTPSFSLVSLPYQAGKEILERSRRERNLPHIHLDIKEQGDERFTSGKGAFGRSDFFGTSSNPSAKRGKKNFSGKSGPASLYKKGKAEKKFSDI